MTPKPQPPVRSDRRRVQRNSIPFGIHVLVEYGIGILTILSPFLFSFDDDAAKIVAVLIGAGILVLAVVTDAPTGLARTLPVASHVVLDYVLGLVFLVTPFVFGFAGDDTPGDRLLHRAGHRICGVRGADALPRREGLSAAALDPRVTARARGAAAGAARAHGSGRARGSAGRSGSTTRACSRRSGSRSR